MKIEEIFHERNLYNCTISASNRYLFLQKARKIALYTYPEMTLIKEKQIKHNMDECVFAPDESGILSFDTDDAYSFYSINTLEREKTLRDASLFRIPVYYNHAFYQLGKGFSWIDLFIYDKKKGCNIVYSSPVQCDYISHFQKNACLSLLLKQSEGKSESLLFVTFDLGKKTVLSEKKYPFHQAVFPEKLVWSSLYHKFLGEYSYFDQKLNKLTSYVSVYDEEFQLLKEKSVDPLRLNGIALACDEKYLIAFHQNEVEVFDPLTLDVVCKQDVGRTTAYKMCGNTNCFFIFSETGVLYRINDSD